MAGRLSFCRFSRQAHISSLHSLLQSLRGLSYTAFPYSLPLEIPSNLVSQHPERKLDVYSSWNRHFGGKGCDDDDDEDSIAENDDEDGEQEETDGDSEEEHKQHTPKDKESEAAAIGYKVIGPLGPDESPFKPYEPVFAVVQIGSQQFKVSNDDCIFTERLKFCNVNDKLIFTRVLLLGSRRQTIVGRPILPDATVNAVVEQHALDAKAIIFKKKRRKNYRRTRGHRQELTKLRIINIKGIVKHDITASWTMDSGDIMEHGKVSAG